MDFSFGYGNEYGNGMNDTREGLTGIPPAGNINVPSLDSI
jgi:hypothetical protein